MAWDFNNTEPIYLQIADEITARIVSGTYRKGEKLPSVRDLAMEAGVNPNTMQKALGYLEQKELVHSERTSGRFVTMDEETVAKLRHSLTEKYVREFTEKMRKTGISYEEVAETLRKEWEEDENGIN